MTVQSVCTRMYASGNTHTARHVRGYFDTSNIFQMLTGVKAIFNIKFDIALPPMSKHTSEFPLSTIHERFSGIITAVPILTTSFALQGIGYN